MKKKILFILAVAGALLFSGTVLGLGGYFYKINPGASEVPHDTFTRGLVGYWDFDEGAGQTATDLSGNQNHGTLGADSSVGNDDPVWTADSPEEGGSSLSFDGADDYVDCGSGSSLDITEAITVEAWVKADGTSNNNYLIVRGAYNNNGWYISTGWSGKLYGYFNQGGSHTKVTSNDNLTVSGEWVHIVLVRSGTVAKFYKNGADWTSSSDSISNPVTSSNNLYIGGNDSVNYLDGQIDQVRIYNRALSAEEVRYHYNRGGPVGSWDFDEGSGSIAYDSTGNDNDGTWNGTGTHWVAGRFGTAGQFADASGDYVSITNNISNAKTISFWTNLDTITEDIISGDGTGITVNSGTMSYGAWDNCFVNGVDTDIITTGWRHVVLTSTSDVSLTAIKLGYTAGGLDGKLDDVKIYQYERSAPEILLDYNKGKAAYFGLATTDCEADPASCMDYGLVGNWGMDEGAGQTATDLSGNQNHGTLGASSSADVDDPTWTADSPEEGGSSLDFDGTDDYVTRADDSDFDFVAADAFSIGAWFKHNTISTNPDYILTKSQAGTNGGYKIYMASDGDIVFEIDDDSVWGPDDSVTTTAATYDDDIWHYLTAIKNGTTGIYIYIDGVQIASDTSIAATGTLANDDALYIGIDDDVSSNAFNGQIDQVRIYNRALSAEEVRYHYNRGGPVASWDFDEGSGSIAYDSTGNDNDGTWNGTGTHWVAGRFGTAGQFADASGDYVSITNNISNAKTISFWTNLDTITEDIISGDGTGITVNSGTMSYGAWDNCFVNGVDTDIITTGWRHVVLTSTSDVSLTAIKLGYTAGGLDGKLDDVKIYQYERSAPEILLDYNKGKAAYFGLATTDCEADPASCMDYGLVGNWGMDEGAGQTATDLSGNQNHGTLGASSSADVDDPTWTADSPEEGGSSLDFDGTDDYVTRADDSDFDFVAADAFSIGAWFKHNTISTNPDYILTKSQAGTNGGYKIYMASDGDIVFEIDDDSVWGPDDSVTTTAATYDDDIWHYLTAIKNGTTGIYIYIDGVQIASDTSIAATGTLANDDALYIGIDDDVSSNAFNGQIDQVRIYNRALSAEEVRYHYNRGGPVAEWKMNERTGAKIYDSTSNNNDGKLNFGAGANDSYEDMWQGASDNLGIEFDGTNDYVDCGNDSSLDITDAITISAWVKPMVDSSYKIIVAKGKYNDVWEFRIDNSNHLEMYIGTDIAHGTKSIVAGNWYHVVTTFDESLPNNNIKLYTNGELDGTPATKTTPISSSNNSIRIGTKSIDGIGLVFNGQINQVRIYNRALGASEILERYEEGKMAHP